MNREAVRSAWPIRTQLLLAVNLTLGAAIVVLLGLRYEREMEQAVVEKRKSLDDQAIAIHASALHLSNDHAPTSVQRYIDSVCRQMCESRSPDHHIVVLLDGEVLQAGSHKGRADALLAALRSATASPGHRVEFRNGTLVVGFHSADGVDVYTSQSLSTIRRAVRQDILQHLGAIAVLGLLAAAIVNVVLLRLVSRPLGGLMRTVEQIGACRFGLEASVAGSREMSQIAEAINSMSRSLDEFEQERRHRLRVACEIQQHLLPNGRIIPGLVTAHLFEPADEVAGDYFDFLQLRDGSWLICIADVTGHGVPAAMGVAMLKMLLVVACEHDDVDPVSVLSFVNQKFCDSTLPEHFASMFLGRWHPATRRLDYASAGHEPPLLLTHRGKLETLSSTGLLLGVDANAEWALQTVTLAPRDQLLFFSDGVIEARSEDGELFGRVRLSAWFSRYAELSPSEIIVQLANALCEHRSERPVDDDVTVLVLVVAEPAHAGNTQCPSGIAAA